MLEGKKVNLRIIEKEEVPQFVEMLNEPEVMGEYNPILQIPRAKVDKVLESPNELVPFFIEKKDGSKVGYIMHFYVLHIAGKQLEIGYALKPSERGKGYCTEAVALMVDYLFLSKESMRIQVQTDQRNVASQRVLEKNKFKKEGGLRKNFFNRGEWTDDFIYSILREEWKEPKILTKTG